MAGTLRAVITGTVAVAGLDFLVTFGRNGLAGPLGNALSGWPAKAVDWLLSPTTPAIGGTTTSPGSATTPSSPAQTPAPAAPLPSTPSSLAPLSPVSSAATGGQAINPPTT